MNVLLLAPVPQTVDPSLPYPLADALVAHGMNPVYMDPRSFAQLSHPLEGRAVETLPSVALLRTMSALDVDVAELLEAKGIRCVNTIEAIRVSSDKWRSYARFVAAGLPVPRTALVNGSPVISVLMAELGMPVLAKPRRGSRGSGIELLRSESALQEFIDRVGYGISEYIFQHFISDPGPHDYRAFVVGDAVVAWMRRDAAVGEILSNLSSGGHGARFQAPSSWDTLAVSAAQSCGLEIAGVDIILDKGEPTLLEVNPTPGFRGISKYATTDVCGSIAAYMAELGRTPPRAST